MDKRTLAIQRAKKRQKKNAEKWADKRFNYLFIAILLLNVLYMTFTWDTTIGHSQYFIPFIIILPAIIGVVVLRVFYKRFFEVDKDNTKTLSRLKENLLITGFALLFSLFIFSLTSSSLFDIANKIASSGKPEEIITCPVKSFSVGKNPKITFLFNKRKESFSVRYRDIEKYKNADPHNYSIELKIQQGIWGYYTVNDYTLIVPE